MIFKTLTLAGMLLAAGIEAGKYVCKTETVKFDNLKVGSNPPDGYGSLDWTEWMVVRPHKDGSSLHPIKPVSKPNVVSTFLAYTGSFVTQGTASGNLTIKSFDAACTSTFDVGPDPVPCAFQVTTPYDAGDGTTKLFNYDSKSADAREFKHFKVNSTGSNFYFNIVLPPLGPGLPIGYPYIYLDNLVVETCTYQRKS